MGTKIRLTLVKGPQIWPGHDEALYWAILAKSRQNTTSQSAQQEFLIHEIARLSPEEMIGFRLRTDKLLYDTYTPDLYCAAYLMNGLCFDDGFEYFRLWVISRGKETYYGAKENPDSLLEAVKDDRDLYGFELFWYVALDAFEARTGKNLYDYIDNDNFKTREGYYPRIESDWKGSEPETMQAICPGLFGRFGAGGRYRWME